MKVETIGAEFNRFTSDTEMWPEGRYYDDAIVAVNGDASYEGSIPADAVVTIDGGFVTDTQGREYGSLDDYFLLWRRTRASTVPVTVLVTVEADRANLDALLAALVAAGGRVVK